MRVVTCKEMKQIEVESIQEFGFSETLIIENVGINASSFLHESILKERNYNELVFLIGKGNNGADGFAIARHLKRMGYLVRAFSFDAEEDCTDELKRQKHLAQRFGVRISHINNIEQLSDYFNHAQESYFVVDAIFGTGIRFPLPELFLEVIEVANRNAEIMVSVDTPSGLNGDQGTFSGKAIQADCTLSIGLPKLGHYLGHGPELTGKIHNIDAGFPEEPVNGGDKFLLSIEDAGYITKIRDRFAHKNTFGSTLLIGGSLGFSGALAMASTASLKVGTGLVTAMTWERNYQEFVSEAIPEVMKGFIPKDEAKWDSLIRRLSSFDSVVIGPGLGRSPQARRVVQNVLNNYNGPVVVDADAINVLSLKEDKNLFALRKSPTLLTPHLGEFARFLGLDVAKVRMNPFEYLKEMVSELNSAVILKGPGSFLAFPSGNTFINYFPNPGLATGGSGDVLAGILGGLFSQDGSFTSKQLVYEDKEHRFEKAVCLGVLTHTLAGRYAADRLGERFMTAGSIIDAFPEVFNEFNRLKSLFGDLGRVKI